MENKFTNPHNVLIVADWGACTAIKLELFLSLPPKNHVLIVKGSGVYTAGLPAGLILKAYVTDNSFK
jgi:hypothetical protein